MAIARLQASKRERVGRVQGGYGCRRWARGRRHSDQLGEGVPPLGSMERAGSGAGAGPTARGVERSGERARRQIGWRWRDSWPNRDCKGQGV